VLEYDFESSVGCWVVSTAHAVKRALDGELQRAGITFRQWEILSCLACRGELSQKELAERIGIEAPTLTSVLTRMERDGWLDRYGCPDDRRKKRLRPTPKAEAVWNRCVECCKRVRAAATEGIPEADLENLRVTCEQIRENLRVADSPMLESSPCR
jgi:DNA-binding MarR family transcriptional regulator